MSKNLKQPKRSRAAGLAVAAAVIVLVGAGVLWQGLRVGGSSRVPTAAPSATKQTSGLVPVVPQGSVQLGPLSGKPAPDFALKTLDGQAVHLSDYRGKAVLINLWATWCPPCLAEMPAIQAAYEKYKDQGLVVLGIDYTAQDNLANVTAFVAKYQLTFPILLDQGGNISSLSYDMHGLPDSYFIDRSGVVRRMISGAIPAELMDGFIQEIIAPPA